jgi:hypothetical protein
MRTKTPRTVADGARWQFGDLEAAYGVLVIAAQSRVKLIDLQNMPLQPESFMASLLTRVTLPS